MFALRSPAQSFLRQAAPSPLTAFQPLTKPSAALLARPAFARSLCNATPTSTPRATNFLRAYRLSLALALPTLALGSALLAGVGVVPGKEALRCEGRVPGEDLVTGTRPRAESMVNVNELGFGTVAGICVGVFVKKGLKLIAFTLGGVFVLMQYFSSRSLITINWKALTSSYDNFIVRNSTKAGEEATVNRSGTLGRVVARFVDFVSADVQSRATFVLGMGLGFRLG